MTCGLRDLRLKRLEFNSMSQENPEIKFLVEAARVAKKFANARYSNFAVGAALQSEDGQVFIGSNVESSSYGLTMCAERVALFKALSEGATKFVRIVVVTDTGTPTPPCGACRQLLHDYAPGVEIVLAGKSDSFQIFSLDDLYPHPFGEGDLS